ncbi:MAG: hypothetical protein HOP18_18480 [Deltaproteobacteria bacterium]|nr:hypothetical protein [Deltaproteobacteria bacterium]
MNDEKRPHPPMTDLLPGEEQLSRLYQETTTEMPPPGLDAALIDAARQATRQKPRRVFFLASRKWTVPLSLAAALVITIGVARSLRHEMTLPPVVAKPSAAAPRSSSDARADARDETLAKRREQEPVYRQEAPAAEPPLRESLEKMTASEPPASPAPQPALGMAQSAPADRQRVGEDVASRRQAPVRRAEERAVAVSPQVPESTILSAPAPQEERKAEEAKKEALSSSDVSPQEWIAKIKKLRHAGNLVEAEANLKAFKQRYPTYPIEKALALPPPSPNALGGDQ